MNQTRITNNKTDKTFRAIWWSGFIDGFIALPILGLIIGYLALQAGWLPAVGRWFVQTNEIHKADAIVILAGGGPERLCHGIELFKRGLAPAIWCTGDRRLPAIVRRGETTAGAYVCLYVFIDKYFCYGNMTIYENKM